MKTKYEADNTLVIDLHNMTVEDAKRQLERMVMAAPANVKEITVIHGYHRGKQLRDMVRNRFKCRRVERKILSLNQGITILILK